jgi:putative oxidoreductase
LTPTAAADGAPAVRAGIGLERAAMVYARLALGTAFLSAVAGRFGIWDRSLDWAHFERFMHRTAEVNAFMPPFTIPFLAWAATAAEISCGVAVIIGVQLRWVALASAVLLGLFAVAMTVSLGVKPPLDSSVFSASAGALLLALRARPRQIGRP